MSPADQRQDSLPSEGQVRTSSAAAARRPHDTSDDQGYDDIARLAAHLCDAPIALVSLVDEGRQRVTSRFGLPICETTREVSFCTHTTQGRGLLLVPDAAADPRFADSPLVTGDPCIRFYAGVPLVTAEGHTLGSLCVIDRRPRTLTTEQQTALLALGRLAVAQMDLRRWGERRGRAILEGALDCIITLDAGGRVLEWNPASEKTFGWTREEASGRTLSSLIVPERMQAAHAAGIACYVSTGQDPLMGRRVERPALRRGGAELLVELTVIPVGSGGGSIFTLFLRDLSAQKGAEDALRASEGRLRTLLESVNAVVYTVASDGAFRYVSPTWTALLGHDIADVVGSSFASFVHPDDVARCAAALDRVMTTGVSEGGLEYRVRHLDGTWRWHHTTGSVPRDEQGHAGNFVGVATDITARKSAEDRLRMLAAAVENANDVIVITEAEPIDQPGPRVVYVNDAFTRLTGYAPDEILGKTPRILQGPETCPQTRAFLRRKLEAWEPVQVELLNYRKDGVPFWSQLNIRPVADQTGWYTHWISIQRDVTERRRAEDAERADAQRREGELTQNLHENEARFRGVVEGLGEGILITDFDDIVLYTNPRMAEMTGWTDAEMRGRPAYEFLLAPEDWPDLRDGNKKRQEGIAGCWEARLRRKDGSWFWGENKATPFRDATGRVVGTLGAITDISARKALQAEQTRLSQRTQLLLDAAGEGFFGIDMGGLSTFVNPAAADMLGYTVEELLGTPMHATVHHTHPDGTPYSQTACPIYASITDGAVHRVTGEAFWRKDGTSFPVEYVSTPVHEEDRLIGAVVTFRDITDRQALEREQARMLAEALERADRDPLTGLLNHRAFQKELEEEADRAQREGGSLVVALLDLDNFKFFNDAYGHSAGDDVLRQVAEALRAGCRSYDTLARFGGDEFALLLPGAAGTQKMETVLLERLAHIGYRPPGYDTAIPISATVGVAVFPGEATSRADVMALADRRLRQAKSGGGEAEDLIASLRARLPASSAEGFAMLSALVTAVDTKDRYTRRHSEDVLAYSLQIASGLSLDLDTRQTVAVAALLHDVGKVGVPDAVLRKPGRLTDTEFKAIQQHPVMGAAIVGAVPGFEAILDAVRHHHEHWDGGGYPAGLRGEETPLIARLMAVADAFSAMTTDRPYRQGMTDAKALSILRNGAGTQWDPACVDAFLRARTLGQTLRDRE